MFRIRQRTSIKITILTHFVLLILITASALIGIQSYFNHQYARQTAHQKFQHLFERIEIKNKALDQQSRALLNFIEEYPALTNLSHDLNSKKALFHTLIKTLSHFPEAYAMYIGYADGQFFEVINMTHRQDLWQRLNSPQDARWGVIEVVPEDGNQAYQFRFYNEALQLISQRATATDYVPSERPWYQSAINRTQVVKSNPYLFWHLKTPGVTYSKRVKDTSSVLAVDFTIDHLTELFERYKPTADSYVMLFNEGGHKILETGSQQDIKPLPATRPLSLNAKEQALVDSTPELRISNQLNWAPFDFVRNGQPHGFSVDVMQWVAAKTGLKIQFVNDYTWQNILEQFNAGRLDMVHSLFFTDQRAQTGSFSDAYATIREYVITRQEVAEIQDAQSLESLTFALVKGWKNTDYLLKHFKQLKFKLYDDTLSRMIAVNKGEADALIGNADTFVRFRAQYQLNDLKLNRPIDALLPIAPEKLRILVRPEYESLIPLINRALTSITDSEYRLLKQRWQLDKNATSSQLSLQDQLFYHVLNQLPSQKENTFYRTKIAQKSFLSAYSAVEFNGEAKTYLAVFVPKSTLMAPYNHQWMISVWVTSAVLLLILWLTHYSSSIIVQPIRALMERNQLVEQRQFDEVTPVETNIKELDELSQTLLKVSDSFQTYEREQDALLQSFIRLIAQAIDAKSPFTGAHSMRVPQIAIMLLEQINREQTGVFSEFKMDEREIKAFKVGAWLHDCGKITTPDFVLDKSTKLDTFYNRIHEIRMRFEVLWRDAEIQYYRTLLNHADKAQAAAILKTKQAELQHEFAWVAEANLATEGMDDGLDQKLHEISEKTWQRHFDDRLGLSAIQKDLYPTESQALPVTEKLLSDRPEHFIPRRNFDHQAYQQDGFKTLVPELLYNLGELHNLTLKKGTLSPEERFKVSEHVMMTLRMLETLPFPEQYQKVPVYAGTHHEKLDGSGYPRQLDHSQLSTPERIMAIADIFEALTAPDRPYKNAQTLSEAIDILFSLCQKGELDGDVFRLLLTSGVYERYAEQYLKPEQIDRVDINRYL